MKFQISTLVAVFFFSFSALQAQVSLSGDIKTPAGTSIGDLEISLLDGSGTLINTYSVDCDGQYSISGLNENEPYTIELNKESNPLNGSTTLDLVLIARHVLGVQALDPYSVYAADVNDSGSATIMDLVVLRMLILGMISELPNSNGWLFFEEGVYSPQASFAIQLSGNSQLNIIGVKNGDVNETASNCE